jgi:hypothetical protein
MPIGIYVNKKTGEKTELLSDLFKCAICGYDKFDYDSNPEYLAGRGDEPFIQKCVFCGNKTAISRKLNSDEKRNLMALKEYEQMIKEQSSEEA